MGKVKMRFLNCVLQCSVFPLPQTEGRAAQRILVYAILFDMVAVSLFFLFWTSCEAVQRSRIKSFAERI